MMIYTQIDFDDEDVMTPESAGMDDVSMRLAEILTDIGATGCFNITGDKVRNLERRGRKDVIKALSKHNLASHTDEGSRHPMPAEYVQSKDWETAVAFVKGQQERCFSDIKRVFGKEPVHMHGHAIKADPVSATVAGLLGKVHTSKEVLSAGEGSFRTPVRNYHSETGAWCGMFWWCGTLCLSSFGRIDGGILAGPPENVDKLVKAMADKLEKYAREPFPCCGLISRGHPMVHRAKYYENPDRFFGTDQYWAINGWNLPAGKFGYLGYPALRSRKEMDRLYSNFRRSVLAIKKLPFVRFMSTDKMAELYNYQPSFISKKELTFQAETIQEKKGFVTDDVFSPAEILLGLCQAVLAFDRESRLPEKVRRINSLGPVRMPVSAPEIRQLSWKHLVLCADEILRYARQHGHLLNNVVFDGMRIGAGSLYESFSRVYKDLLAGKKPQKIETDRVFPRVPKKGMEMAKNFLGYEEIQMYEPEMSVDNLYKWIKLQSWTIKRAIYKK